MSIERSTRAVVTLGLSLGVLAGGCSPGDEAEETAEDTTLAEDTLPQRTIQEVMGDYGDQWMVRTEVTGLGIGRCGGEPCIVVYLTRELPEDAEPLPGEVEGYTVRTEVIGRVVPRGGGDDDA